MYISCIFVVEIKTIEIMTTYIKTQEQVKFSNGRIRIVYSKMTKKGNRFFTYSFGRWFPISKQRINELSLLNIV